MAMRVLITGALGYLGGRISLELSEAAGVELRLSTRRPRSAQPDWARDFEVVRTSAGDAAGLDRLCRGIDAVIHLAGANEIASAADPAQALVDTGLGTLELLGAADRQGVGRFLYMSTAHVYGAPLVGRIDESTAARPVHPYAITHRTAEDFVLAASARGALEGLVIRLSNALGAPSDVLIDRWTLVGNDLCRQAAADGALTLRTNGLQQRDFIALSDVCRAVQHLLALPSWSEGDGIFNLGGERAMSIIDLAELIAARGEIVLGFRAPIIRPDTRGDTPPAPIDYRIDRLRRTGFSLAGCLEDEIDRTLLLCRDAFEAKEHVP